MAAGQHEHKYYFLRDGLYDSLAYSTKSSNTFTLSINTSIEPVLLPRHIMYKLWSAALLNTSIPFTTALHIFVLADATASSISINHVITFFSFFPHKHVAEFHAIFRFYMLVHSITSHKRFVYQDPAYSVIPMACTPSGKKAQLPAWSQSRLWTCTPLDARASHDKPRTGCISTVLFSASAPRPLSSRFEC